MNAKIYDHDPEVYRGYADYFKKLSEKAMAATGRFSVSLSGGSTPQKLFDLLVKDFSTDIDWKNIYFFIGDERHVPADHERNNGKIALEKLLQPLNINDKQLHTYKTDLPADECAAEYAQQISDFFKGEKAVFDCVMLGLGDNSHTASLFPHQPVLLETEATVRAFFLPEEGIHRITMTAPLINQAANVSFIVLGDNKARAVQHVIVEDENIEEYPAQLITKDALWFLDKAAAKYLNY